jgi:hypothetical protein
MTAALAYWQTLRAALTADTATSALLTNAGSSFVKIYDEVPRDSLNALDVAKSPFVYLGPVAQRRLEAEAEAWNVQLRVYIVSTKSGRAEVHAIADAMIAVMQPVAFGPQVFNSAAWSADVVKVKTLGDIPAPANPKQAFLDLETNVISTTASSQTQRS